MPFRYFALCIILLALFIYLRGGQTATTPIVWTVSGMERVAQDAPPKQTNHIEIYAARGEYEAFQVVIQAPQSGLTNVNFTVSDLRGQSNQVIPQTNITLYREHYVYVSTSSPDLGEGNRSLGPGWYPDALIPFVDPITQQPPVAAALRAVPFDLAQSKNQPLWIDVFVPRDAQAGEYTGVFTVNSDQGAIEGTFRLMVWDFTLPLKPSLASSFGLHGSLKVASANELLKHKLMPTDTVPAYEHEWINNLGLTSTNLGFWSGATQKDCSMAPLPSVQALREAAAERWPGLLLYAYTADEIDKCTNLYQPLKRLARNLHRAGILNLVTMTPVPDLYDDGSGTGRSAVDIWVLLPKMYDAAPERVAEVLHKGDQVWSYNALVQDPYSPKWEIGFAPINFRIQPGFISQSLGLTGLLYWRVDLWTDDPWNKVQTYAVGDNQYPGEGMLVYPGDAVGITGVVPSMRLKWLREGVEDYEYMEILKRRGRGEFALAVARNVGADWSHWTHDPAVLESARKQLAEAIVASNSSSVNYLPLISMAKN